MSTNIHTDKPASIKAEDSFQRYEFAKRIASIVSAPNNDRSLIVGLYGKWGEGKTTVLNFIQQELPEETVVVNFNPWLFSDEQHLLKSFFSSISEALGARDRTIKEKFGEFLSDYGGAIGSITQFVGVNMEGVEKLGNKLKSTSIEQLKKRIDDLIIQSGKNIVVFVDDIDRLDIGEIQYVFKLVKLVGDFPRTSYILSFDDEMVSAALAPKYGGDNKAAGYNFLEKIIQVPLKIPKANKKALYKYTVELLNKVLKDASVELSQAEINDFIDIFNTAFLPFMDNPRLAIRYANSLAFSLPLLKGEVNIGNLTIIEGIKIFYPELYDFIRHNSVVFSRRTDSLSSDYRTASDRQKEIKDKIAIAIGIYHADKQKVVIEMLQELFPQLKAVYSNTTYPDTAYVRWAKEKKICSGKYFDRYFSYSVLEGDIPDNYFDQLLIDLRTNSVENLLPQFTQALDQYDAFEFIIKLRRHEEDLDEEQSKNLALVLSKVGNTLPVEEDFHFATTYAQAARLIESLIRTIAPTDRLSFLLKVLSETASMEYAMEINYWIMYKETNHPDTAIFSEQDEFAIQQHLVDRFLNEMTDDNFFELVSDSNLWRILSWWHLSTKHKEELTIFWNKHLSSKNNPEFAFKVIKIFTPTINSSSISPLDKRAKRNTYKSGFYESNFNALKEVADVNLINENLMPVWGMNPHETGPTTVSDREPIDDKTLVSVFQWFIEKDEVVTHD